MLRGKLTSLLFNFISELIGPFKYGFALCWTREIAKWLLVNLPFTATNWIWIYCGTHSRVFLYSWVFLIIFLGEGNRSNAQVNCKLRLCNVRNCILICVVYKVTWKIQTFATISFMCLCWTPPPPPPPSSSSSSSSSSSPPSSRSLWQIHNLLQIYFSKQCDLVLPLTISSTFDFPWGRTVAAYMLFLVFPSLLSFLKQSVLESSSYGICAKSSQPSSFYCM